MTKRKSNKKWIWFLAAFIVVFLIVAVIKSKSKPKGEVVEIEKIERHDIVEKVTASGKVFPETEVKISSDVSGEVVNLYVKEGDSVTIGQVLAKIDPEAYISAVDRAKASMNGAQAQLAVSRSSVQNYKAQKGQILAQLKNAEQIYERNKKLYNDGVISLQDYQSAESNLDALKANLQSADAGIQSSIENVNAADFTVKSMAASLKEIQTSLQKTTITAPTNGVISMLNIEQGERVVGTIQMAGTEMMRISNFSSMEVRVEVSENDILRVNIGDEVDIEIDAYVGRTFKGIVTEIANSAANVASSNVLTSEQVTNFVVKIRLDPDSYEDLIQPGKMFPLRPGMSTSVEILTETVADVLGVPIQAVTTREAEEDEDAKEKDKKEDDLLEVVFVKSGDTVMMKEVVTGIQDDDYIEVLEGLEEGNEIVIGPYNAIAKKLEDGSEVHIKEEDEKDKKKKK
jgi:HlyD family secretion protein